MEGDPAAFAIPDFRRIATGNSHLFRGNGNSLPAKVKGAVMEKLLAQRPQLKSGKCVGCGVCGKICPADAITMDKGRPRIDRKKCIRCFCCQEFCPEGAMVARRTATARFLDH